MTSSIIFRLSSFNFALFQSFTIKTRFPFFHNRSSCHLFRLFFSLSHTRTFSSLSIHPLISLSLSLYGRKLICPSVFFICLQTFLERRWHFKHFKVLDGISFNLFWIFTKSLFFPNFDALRYRLWRRVFFGGTSAFIDRKSSST